MIARALSLGGIPISERNALYLCLVRQGLPRSASVGADQNQRG